MHGTSNLRSQLKSSQTKEPNTSFLTLSNTRSSMPHAAVWQCSLLFVMTAIQYTCYF